MKIDYMGYPLDGLLYDAKRGSTLSITLIYDLFCDCVENKREVPAGVAELVAKEIRAVTSGRQSPDEMFKKHKKRGSKDPTEAASAVEIFLPGRTIEEAIELASELTGLPEGTVHDRYYKSYKKRCSRINQVSQLLRELEQIQSKPVRNEADRSTVQKIFDDLREIYLDADLK